MNTTTNSALVDVLAARAAEILAERLDDGSSIDRENLAIRIARLEQRDAAVAELIEVQEAAIADLEYAVAIVGQHNDARAEAISLRLQRHRAALASCGGAP